MVQRLWQNIIFFTILVLILICLLYAAFRVIEREKVETGQETSSAGGKYRQIWMDDFTLVEKKEPLNYIIWDGLNLPGSSTKLLNDRNNAAEAVGTSTGNDGEESLYTTNIRNIFVKERLYLRMLFLKEKVTTASIITKAVFVRGFFILKIRIGSDLQRMGFPFIRLQSYLNHGMNIIGNDYGKWSESGEIDILEPLQYSFSCKGKPQLEWTGKLWFGETAVPNTSFKPLKLNKSYTLGLQWLQDRMVWYKNPEIGTTGLPSGEILGTIDSSEWFAVNKKGKYLPPPAPFDAIRSLNIGVAAPGARYPPTSLSSFSSSPLPLPSSPSSLESLQSLQIDYIQIYQQTSTSSLQSTSSVNFPNS